MAAKKEGSCFCSPVAGSSLSLSSLIVAVTGAFFHLFADELSVTTGAGFSVSLGRTYSGRVTTGGASVPTELCYLPQSFDLELELLLFENLAFVTVHFNILD